MRTVLVVIAVLALTLVGCSKDNPIETQNTVTTEKSISENTKSSNGEHEFEGEEEGEFGNQDVDEVNGDENKKEEMAVKDLPETVRLAIEKTYPGGVIEEASLEKENDTTLYDIEVTAQGYEYDVEVTPDGKIVEISEEIEITSLPDIITQSLNKAYPGSVLKEAEKVTENGMVTYEVKISAADKEFEVILDTAGKVLSEAPENEDIEDAGSTHEFDGEEEGEN